VATESKSPAEVLSTLDPGDDVQLRFRYQAVYAARLALGILVSEIGILEIYCEQHGDVLIRMSSGAFRGCQVKTRHPKYGPFKSDEQPMIESISRFVGMDLQFPGRFDRFVLAVNCGFWAHKQENEKNLHCLKARACKAVESGNTPTRGTLAQIIKTIKLEQKCDGKSILRTICKLELQEDLPELSFAEKDLVFRVGEIYKKDTTLDRLSVAADQLINLVLKASSLANTSSVSFYFSLFDNPAEAKEQDVIAGKRVTKDLVSAVIAAVSVQTPLLTNNGAPRLVKGFSKAEQKFTAGGISKENIESFKDFQASLEVLMDEWGYKYDFDEAARRYNHLQLIVREQCFDAEGKSKASQQDYGIQMLQEVRKNLKERYQLSAIDFRSLDCEYEHLLGVVGDLTEKCDVWWSEKFGVTD
jgi:Cap4 dsDNA endonuclease